MQLLQNVARRYGLVCLLHEKPFAGVNGSGKHNNWSMGTDTGVNLLEPGDDAEREHAVPVLLRGRHPGRQQAPGAAARVGRQRRPGPPPRRQRGAAGDHLDLPRRASSRGSSTRSPRARPPPRRTTASSGSARRSLPPLPMHGGDRNRTSPFAFTGNKFEFRMLGSSSSLGFPNTVLNTIAAEAIDELAGRAGGQARRRHVARRGRRRGRQRRLHGQPPDRLRRRQLRRRVAHRGRAARALQPALDARRAAVVRRRADRRGHVKYGVLSERELEARYEVAVEQLLDEAQHRGRDRGVDRAHDAAAGRGAPPQRAHRLGPRGPDRRVRADRRRLPQGDRRAREGQRGPRPGGHGARAATSATPSSRR